MKMTLPRHRSDARRCARIAANRCRRATQAFTLVELLTVIAIIAVLTALLKPAFTSLNTAGNISGASFDLAEALQNARAYAMANSTYVWVGFFEETEDQNSTTPATAGTGRIVLSIVASRDGTMIYNPTSLPITSTGMTQSLTQISKLLKIDNMHLQAFTAGTGTGNTFASRPAVSNPSAQIGPGALAAGSSEAPFQYPVGNPAPNAQYTFNTSIQFSPRGEAQLNDATQPIAPLLEIGLQPTHGTVVDANSANVAAVQIGGITGAVAIYRP